VSARTREEGRLSQCEHFSDKGRGVNFNFSDFMQTSFVEAPKHKHLIKLLENDAKD